MDTKIPKRLQIETIYGCNARCVMCALTFGSSRPKGIMTKRMFKSVVDSLVPYSGSIDKTDLFAMGEPMLDPHIFERIRYVRDGGFKNVAISTNADLLNDSKQRKLLETGIETVIFSIDGINKKTHESIRPGVMFENVISNCQSIIRKRDKGNYKTRFLMRFIRQESNSPEWEEFRAFWRLRLSPVKGDRLIKYDVNTMGGAVFSKAELVGDRIDQHIEELPCHQVFDRLIVLSDGTVPLCCEDTPKAKNIMGNVKDDSAINIFNGKSFRRMREIHRNGQKNSIPVCENCTMLYSEANIEFVREKVYGV